MSDTREDAKEDLTYCNGFRAGWNAALSSNGEELAQAVESKRALALRELIASRRGDNE